MAGTPRSRRAGRTRYAANCAACHGASLQGGAGPALSRSSFAAKWRNHPLSDLHRCARPDAPHRTGIAPGEYVVADHRVHPELQWVPGRRDAVSAAEFNRAITPPQSGKSATATLTSVPKPPVVPVTQPSTHIVSQAELDAADSEPTNWLTYNKGYKGFR